MNHYIERFDPGIVKASDFADWALAHGVPAFTTQEVAYLIGVPKNQVPQRMASLKKKGRIFTPARGLWIPVEPMYREWGTPDPMHYIDEIMSYLKTDYRVGWLTSAALQGASHQSPQVFQVAVEKPTRWKNNGGMPLRFYARENVKSMSCSTRNGRVKVATPGTTMLMMASDLMIGAGPDNVATVIVELAEENPGFEEQLLKDASLFSDVALRRAGWMLDEFGEGAPAEVAELASKLDSEVSFLSPVDKRQGKLNSKWNLIVNRKVDPDL